MTTTAQRIIIQVLDAGGWLKAGHPPLPYPLLIPLDGYDELRRRVDLNAPEIHWHLIGHESIRPLEMVWHACVEDIGRRWEEGGMPIWASDVELEDKVGRAMKLDPPDLMAVQLAIAAWRRAWLEQLKPS